MKTTELTRICREYTAELVEAVKNEKNDARLLEYFEFCSRFHNYSFQNRILIWLSRPDATFVAGFKAWQKMGRFVKKGEKGIPIFAPMMIKVKKGEEWDPELVAVTEESSRPEDEILRFKVVYVWDVSQTDGDPLPENPDVMSVKGELDGELLPALEEVVRAEGIGLNYVNEVLGGGAAGVSKKGRIDILSSLDTRQRFSVLAHELAHEMLHGPQQRRRLTKKVKELEAEATAYVISRHFDLDTKAPTYLACYRVEEVDIMASLDRIVSTASKIIRGIVRQQIEESLQRKAA
ncbi:MAG: hypothetical protein DRG82_13650 [Deltaproteobacteria bacterium]|nr:MAG: hypothetical protein DRG82_13650 [Deltaproteobacteria bacterium]